MTITRKTLLALLLTSTKALRRVAIVTGGTRGVGLGISQALAENDFDLLLTYNSDSAAAEKAVLELKNQFPICAIETVGGDVSLPETRKAIFDKFDSAYAKTHCLGAVVHNAGQYVGVSSTNAAGIKATGPPPGFGDGSLLGADGGVDFTQMHYYQKMYGDAFVDLCERGLARFPEDGGSLVGISSPGCTLPERGVCTAASALPPASAGSSACTSAASCQLHCSPALRAASKSCRSSFTSGGVAATSSAPQRLNSQPPSASRIEALPARR